MSHPSRRRSVVVDSVVRQRRNQMSTSTSESSHGRNPLWAGIGAIAFSTSTVAALVIANPPGGNYSASNVTDYLASGHRIAVLIVMHLALIGLVGLISMLAHFRDMLPAGTARSAFWGTGVAAAGAFAVGWSIVGGQIVAHWEGGSAIKIPLAVTYLISEVGAVLIYGAGAVMLGSALIVLVLNTRGLLPSWLRRMTLGAGIAGIAGLAFITFYLLMLWGVVVGVWLVTRAVRSAEPLVAPSTGV
jgi:hypothetical protein